jgi:predicted metal-dependent TIM-barrel fold hydrolase
VIATPWRGRERATRRILAVLREAEVEPARVLIAGADARTVRAIRACGHLAGLSLDGDGLERAVRLVRLHGPEGLVLGTDAGLAGGDLLALARAADRLSRGGLSEAVIRRVCGGNALAFLGVDAAALRGRRSAR